MTVPARGTTNAKSRTPPAPKFSVNPETLTLSTELPKPKRAPLLSKLPKTVVSTTGVPEAKGIIEPGTGGAGIGGNAGGNAQGLSKLKFLLFEDKNHQSPFFSKI